MLDVTIMLKTITLGCNQKGGRNNYIKHHHKHL
jgi:hypothetical protein